MTEYCKLFKSEINFDKKNKIKKSLTFLKNKAKTLEDIWSNAQYIVKDSIEISSDDKKLLDDWSKTILKEFTIEYEKLSSLSRETLEPVFKTLIEKHKTNFKGVGQPLRIILTGSKFGPGIYDILISLGKKRVLDRLSKVG